jgi:hypothetical protein
VDLTRYVARTAAAAADCYSSKFSLPSVICGFFAAARTRLYNHQQPQRVLILCLSKDAQCASAELVLLVIHEPAFPFFLGYHTACDGYGRASAHHTPDTAALGIYCLFVLGRRCLADVCVASWEHVISPIWCQHSKSTAQADDCYLLLLVMVVCCCCLQYTFILPASKNLPSQVIDFKTGKTKQRKSVGVRMPDEQITQVRK